VSDLGTIRSSAAFSIFRTCLDTKRHNAVLFSQIDDRWLAYAFSSKGVPTFPGGHCKVKSCVLSKWDTRNNSPRKNGRRQPNRNELHRFCWDFSMGILRPRSIFQRLGLYGETSGRPAAQGPPLECPATMNVSWLGDPQLLHIKSEKNRRYIRDQQNQNQSSWMQTKT
jgi:hypothetical protein